MNALGLSFSHGVLAGGFAFETYATLPKSRSKKQRVSPAEQAAAYGLAVEEVGPIDSERLIAFIWRSAGRPLVCSREWKRERPLVIWLDNYSVHKSQRVKEELPAFEQAGITLRYLPSYAPELSKIEPIWHQVKHHEMTRRSYETIADLKQAVEGALRKKADALLAAHRETARLLYRAA